MTQHSPTWRYRANTGNNPVHLRQTQVKRPIYAVAIMSLLRVKVIRWSPVVASDWLKDKGYDSQQRQEIFFIPQRLRRF
jgi:hypothetical protein